MIGNEPETLAPEKLKNAQETLSRLQDTLNKIILGQEEMIEQVILGILARGHILLEGLPGLGKTELVKALSSLLNIEFSRIQFTPDLLPSDITGAPILQDGASGKREFVFQQGPLFANLILADEINRASPKTQAAMLEAMQEHFVTVMGESRPLPSPFFVLATQNPIELEGTYPLPEAQLDRFLFKVHVGNVDASVLAKIVSTRHRGEVPSFDPVIDAQGLQEVFAYVDQIYLPPAVSEYIARLVNATHPAAEGDSELANFIKYGASPRAAIAIAEAARARALLKGRPGVGFDDVKAVTFAALNHRILLSYTAKLEGVNISQIVDRLLKNIDETGKPLPKGIVDDQS